MQAPGPVTDLRATTATTTSIRLAWTNPDDADYDGVEIRRLRGAVAPADRTEGTPVRDTGPATTAFNDTELLTGVAYSYALFPHDDAGNFGPPSTLTAVTDNGDPVSTADWPQGRQGAERRAWSRNETVIRPTNVGLVDQEWSLAETGVPVIDGSTLYVSGPDENGVGQLAAYDLDTGDLLWRKGTDTCFGQLALVSTFIVVGCTHSGSNGSIRAYRRSGTHAEVWDTADTDPEQIYHDVLVVGATVVAYSATRVTAYQSSDGQRIWQQLALAPQPRVWDVAASGDRVLVAYDDRLRALSLSNGTQLWSQPGNALDVVVADGWAYTQGNQTVRRYALANGDPGWSVTPEHGADGLFAADNGTIYVWNAEFESGGLTYSELSALRVSDGAQRWFYNVPARVGSVSVAGSVVWLTSSSISNQGQFSSLIALHRPDGALLQRRDFSSNIPTITDRAPAIAVGGGKVVLNQGGTGGPEPRRMRVFGLDGARPRITSAVLPLGRVGLPYSHQLTSEDAPGPTGWSITAGTLPAGLTLTPAGVLSGTPTVVGTTQVTIRATSSNGRSDEQSFPIQVVPSSSSTDWRIGGSSPSRNPFSPGIGTLDITAAPTFAFRWQTAQTTQPGYHAANVVINGERFYTVAGDGMLKAYRTTGGSANRAPLWSAPVPAAPTNKFRGFVSLASGLLIVADADERRLHAVQASNGDPVWKTDQNAAHASFDPLIVGDTLVAVDNFGELKAYAMSNGDELWEETATARIGFGELSSDGTRIYGMAECVLYAIDPGTGAELWSTPTLTSEEDCATTTVQPAPIVVGGRVYATEMQSKLVANAATGAPLFRFKFSNEYGAAGVVVGGTWVFSTPTDIIAVDVYTGRRVWTVPPPSPLYGRISIAATGDLLILSTYLGIAGLDRLTGLPVWDGGSIDGDGFVSREPLAIGNNRILVPTLKGVRAYGPL